jgi:ribosome-binding protein aMBF1 (putative translation factor)
MQKCEKCGKEPRKIGYALVETFILGMCWKCAKIHTAEIPEELLLAMIKGTK